MASVVVKCGNCLGIDSLMGIKPIIWPRHRLCLSFVDMSVTDLGFIWERLITSTLFYPATTKNKDEAQLSKAPILLQLGPRTTCFGTKDTQRQRATSTPPKHPSKHMMFSSGADAL